MEPVIEEGIRWYWTVGGVLFFAGILFVCVKRIRDTGKGSLADWIRSKWPVNTRGGI